MKSLNISCESCGQTWTVANTFSVYEQQALESCPCPHCGAYTLCCHDPDDTQASEANRRQWRHVPARV